MIDPAGPVLAPSAPLASHPRDRVGDAAVEIVRLGLLALAASALGAGTSVGQGALPGALQPLANSASGWTLCTVLLVALLARRTWSAVLGGIAGFALLNLGYTVMSNLSGHPDTFSGFWVVAGFVVGGPIGLAAHWLASDSRWRVASGAAALAAIGLGDAAFGLMRPASSTIVYDLLIGAAALVLLVVCGRRLHAPGPVVGMASAAVVLAALYVVALGVLG